MVTAITITDAIELSHDAKDGCQDKPQQYYTMLLHNAAHHVKEAEHHANQANKHIEIAGRAIIEFYRDEAWRITGHASFRDAYAAITGAHSATAYRILNTMLVNAELAELNEGHVWGSIKQSHAQELAKLPTPELKQAALIRAKNLAYATGQEDNISKRHISEAVMIEQRLMNVKHYPYLQMELAAGRLHSTLAIKIADAFDASGGTEVSVVLQLFAAHGIPNDIELIKRMLEDAKRIKSNAPSSVLQEVIDSGEVNGVKLSQARSDDYQRAKYNARADIIESAKPPMAGVYVTLYPDDPERSAQEIRKRLDKAALMQLLEYLSN